MTAAVPSVNPLFPGPHWTSHQFIADEVMDDQFKHHLGMMLFGMSDLGECLEVARSIAVDDEESWIQAWTPMAQALQARAESAEAAGRTVTAADCHLRASTYWRASLMHFGPPDDPRMAEHARRSYQHYDRYLELSGYPGEYLAIPYEGSFLPSYLYRSPVADQSAPLLIFFQGRDAWPEDTRWVYDGAIRRGIHCLAVQCPGQGLALRLNGLPFRPDWENVVTPIVDVAVGLDGVDADRIALMGLSFGGYLAPRAAAYEKRLKLCIADPGVLSWWASISAGLPPSLMEAYGDGPEAFNAAAGAIAEQSSTAGWFLRDSCWKHGVDTPYALMKEFEACDLTDVAKLIECETLVMDGVDERFSTGQAEQLYEALECPKELMLFGTESTAQLHCQNGATATAAEHLFDWLADRL
ncbi:alpha/beta hydrolase family protein [Jiangella alba]|uniref:Alpha/beta hydrolase family protein n=1 Tax=Jiangella alba TaxID=561176 RepID=A0A1H5PFL8_9ACTN|nr:alpha/beta fold hydrolase [Jiangella alba]SEF11881.1 Alpha/beta hydrolase family protein [Jiangella alba]